MILYIGNKLSKHGNTASAVETLGPLLAEYYDVFCISDKVRKIERLLDIVRSIISHQKKIKVILIDTYSTQGFYFALISGCLASLLRIPYVLLLRGGNLEVRLKDSPRLSRTLFKRAFSLVAPSQFLFDTFKRYGFDNLLYIPNNITIGSYDFMSRAKTRPRLLWVRSFSNIYNPLMALDLVKRLRLFYPDIELCMVGPEKDGSLKLSTEYSTTIGVQDRVQFKGKMEKPDWHRLAKNYDIFINTSNVDNTPVSVIEAMALGLPVVSTKAGGIPYLIDDKINGLLVELNDLSGMVMEIKRLIDDPDLAMFLASNARAKIEGFDWNIVKQSWFGLLNPLVNNDMISNN